MLSVVLFLLITSFINKSLEIERLEEDAVCKNRDGIKGVCKRFHECPTAVAAIRKKNPPKICKFIDDKPVVCCPPGETSVLIKQGTLEKSSVFSPKSPSQKSVAIANKYCAEYAKSVLIEVEDPALAAGAPSTTIINLCARIEEPLVLGGEDAKAKEYPHMALIGFKGPNIRWRCGGSLISDRFVLSAAHCSVTSLGPAKWVKLGELDQKNDLDNESPLVIKIIQRIVHPDYRSTNLYNDITLFKLENPVIFNEFIRPTCLSTTFEIPWHTAIATGWGHLEYGGKRSSMLQKVRLNLVNTETCHKLFDTSNTSSQIPQGIIESQICAGGEKGKDTCQEDSGGPLQSPIDTPYCMYELMGITSFGRKCGIGYPGVYTRVAYFLDWIVENVWPDETS